MTGLGLNGCSYRLLKGHGHTGGTLAQFVVTPSDKRNLAGMRLNRTYLFAVWWKWSRFKADC